MVCRVAMGGLAQSWNSVRHRELCSPKESTMLLRIAALGTLGYVGYKFLTHRSPKLLPAVAGGPLSPKATLQSDAAHVPPIELYEDM